MSEASAPEPVQTGVASVDAALEEIAALEDRPLEEHPAVFEQVHDRLRSALQNPDQG